MKPVHVVKLYFKTAKAALETSKVQATNVQKHHHEVINKKKNAQQGKSHSF